MPCVFREQARFHRGLQWAGGHCLAPVCEWVCGAIFSIEGGWAGAIASKLAPTGGLCGGWYFGLALRFFGAFCVRFGGWLSVCSGMDRRICSVELPLVLMLLLTCNACYTSAIDKPFGH
ncbi:hypothetical protein D3C81_494310 [compost metagenome]